MLTFATLGPSGSNHELVTRAYLRFHGLDDEEIVLVESFAKALALMAAGEVAHEIQVAVHPETTETVARAHFRHGIHVIDTFISASHPLAILTRQEVARPRTLALQPATKEYADTSRWETFIPETSTATVAAGLLAGRYDSGLTWAHLADQHPGRFRIDEEIGTVDDPWIVYGREGTSGGKLLAWKESPAARLYRRGA
ncbi:MAG: hypothetical protein QF893_18690 [Alphaproteobacteria bacterium]|jgi:hypothetical protein|nr:hypothetical protein [Alphaproteobacteria bacterium]